MTEGQARKRPHGWANFGLDFGPLLAFFAAYTIAKGSMGSLLAALAATFVFMIAILIAMVLSLYFYRRVSPMMWISAVLVIGFGGLTLYFHDPRFIQLKPTLIYAGFSAMLFGGLIAGKPLLKHIFGPIFEGLDQAGWMKISRNWAFFFGFLALMNEVLRVTVSFDTWLALKVWGATGLSFLFAALNLPMLLRHGLLVDEPASPPAEPVD